MTRPAALATDPSTASKKEPSTKKTDAKAHAFSTTKRDEIRIRAKELIVMAFGLTLRRKKG